MNSTRYSWALRGLYEFYTVCSVRGISKLYDVLKTSTWYSSMQYLLTLRGIYKLYAVYMSNTCYLWPLRGFMSSTVYILIIHKLYSVFFICVRYLWFLQRFMSSTTYLWTLRGILICTRYSKRFSCLYAYSWTLCGINDLCIAIDLFLVSVSGCTWH